MKRIVKIIAMSMALASMPMTMWANSYEVSQDEMLNRFLNYVKINSQSIDNKNQEVFPMTEGQKEMAQFLADEAKALGANVYMCPNYYVYVEIPSNVKANVPTLGISCHYDVTPEAVSGNITPKVIKYEGGDINQGGGRVISPDSDMGQELKNHIGKTIIHSDGTTLLGGDDKNGCAITMSVVESLIKGGKKVKHGKVQVVFCPNEDIGRSAEKIDKNHFNPDIIYDMDGEGGKDVAVSNFSARRVDVKFVGRQAHPGDAKRLKMGDALAAASMYIASTPLECRPENTEGRQGYIHSWKLDMDSTMTEYRVQTRIRYFDKSEGALFDSLVMTAIENVKRDFPNVKVEIVHDGVQYENVEYFMHPQSKDIIAKAAEKTGVEIKYIDSRGGVTASMFCTKGLKGGMCVFTGQYATHSTKEYSVLEEMHDAYRLMMEVVSQVAKVK